MELFADLLREPTSKRARRVLGGYAGTGKTTIIAEILRRHPNAGVAVCTPTGKAAHVLRSKGVPAGTIHSLLYYPPTVTDEGLEFAHVRARYDLPKVLIVDEASMLDAKLVEDIERRITKVLYVGDHGQLEPIRNDPGIMRHPDVQLEHIHRQAEGSPIIRFANIARVGERLVSLTPECRVTGPEPLAELSSFDVVLVGFNETRHKLNAWIRHKRGFTGPHPQVGEQVICLRNDKTRRVWNGMTASVVAVDPVRKLFDLLTDGGPRRNVLYDPTQFGQALAGDRRGGPTAWDWGYAITVHKAQGSEWSRIAVVEEIASTWDDQRWRYTAATRAKNELRWIIKD